MAASAAITVTWAEQQSLLLWFHYSCWFVAYKPLSMKCPANQGVIIMGAVVVALTAVICSGQQFVSR